MCSRISFAMVRKSKRFNEYCSYKIWWAKKREWRQDTVMNTGYLLVDNQTTYREPVSKIQQNNKIIYRKGQIWWYLLIITLIWKVQTKRSRVQDCPHLPDNATAEPISINDKRTVSESKIKWLLVMQCLEKLKYFLMIEFCTLLKRNEVALMYVDTNDCQEMLLD